MPLESGKAHAPGWQTNRTNAYRSPKSDNHPTPVELRKRPSLAFAISELPRCEPTASGTGDCLDANIVQCQTYARRHRCTCCNDRRSTLAGLLSIQPEALSAAMPSPAVVGQLK